MNATKPAIVIRGLIPILAMLSAFSPIAIDMYLPGMSHMAEMFQTTPGHIQATVTAFFLGLAIGQAIYGPLIDRFGRKPVLLIGIAIYMLASFACIWVTDIETFIALRFLQAIGGSSGMMIGRAIVNDLYDRTETARIFSLLMMIVILAPIAAPVTGGWMLVHFGWQSIFLLMLLFAGLCAVLVFFLVPETLNPANRQPLSFSQTFATYASLLTNRRFVIPALAGALVQSCLFAYITGSEFVFTQIFRLSEQQFSLLFAVNAMGVIVGNFGNRYLLKKWPVDKILGAALLLNVVAGAALLLLVQAQSLLLLCIPLWLMIASLGFISANAAAIAMGASGKNAGSGSGLIGVMQFGVAFVVSGAVALSQNGTAYPMTLAMALCGMAASVLWYLCRPRRG